MSAASLPVWADALIAVLLVAGGLFALVGALALVKFTDFYKRLHGPTKATTLGVGGVLLASSVYFSVRGGVLSVHEFLISLFLFLTAPVAAHMLISAALHLRVRQDAEEDQSRERVDDASMRVRDDGITD